MFNNVLFVIIICILVYTILVASILKIKYNFSFYNGEYESEKHIKNIVIDTLNMTYEIHKKSKSYHITNKDILSTIRIVTNKLKPIVSDKIIFITKTSEKLEQNNDDLDSYDKISKELGVYIYIVNKLKKPNKNTFVRIKKSHSTLGRDDFYIMITASKLKCPVLGQDYYNDLKNMKFGELDSFYVTRYSPYIKFSDCDYVNPTGQEYKKMKPPSVIRWDSL